MNPIVKYILASLYRLAVLAGFIYLVRLAFIASAPGWLFLILPLALVFLIVAPSPKAE
jgi:hypothetical protein